MEMCIAASLTRSGRRRGALASLEGEQRRRVAKSSCSETNRRSPQRLPLVFVFARSFAHLVFIMNIELLEQFGQNYPEEFDGTLDCISLAVTCAFNRRGTLLAVGCNDGRIVIWDFLTRGIAKVITAHVHPLCSLR